MYINLNPNKQLNKTKQFVLWAGLLLIVGGNYAIVQEVLIREHIRLIWAIGACAIIVFGIVGICLGTDRILLKDTFFSINPDFIKYRLSLYSQENKIYWADIESISIGRYTVNFVMKEDKQVTLRLGNLQSLELEHHVATSLRLAAMDKRISVNGVSMQEQKMPYKL